LAAALDLYETLLPGVRPVASACASAALLTPAPLIDMTTSPGRMPACASTGGGEAMVKPADLAFDHARRDAARAARPARSVARAGGRVGGGDRLVEEELFALTAAVQRHAVLAHARRADAGHDLVAHRVARLHAVGVDRIAESRPDARSTRTPNSFTASEVTDHRRGRGGPRRKKGSKSPSARLAGTAPPSTAGIFHSPIGLTGVTTAQARPRALHRSSSATRSPRRNRR
jgi:hypothetical protein